MSHDICSVVDQMKNSNVDVNFKETRSMKKISDKTKRNCFLILGAHRSGTSLITRLVTMLGINLPSNVVGPGPGNEAGHWEPLKLVEFHEGMLAELGSTWYDWTPLDFETLSGTRREQLSDDIGKLVLAGFGGSANICIKDPRITRFAGFFSEAIQKIGYNVIVLIALRNPLDVCNSLIDRDAFWPAGYDRTDAMLHWLSHMLAAERFARHHVHTIVSYEAVMADPIAAISRAFELVGIQTHITVSDAADDIRAFVDADLQHHAHEPEQLLTNPLCSGWIADTFAALRQIESGHNTSVARESLDHIRAEFLAAVPLLNISAGDRRKMHNEILALKEKTVLRATEPDAAINEEELLGARHQSQIDELNASETALRGKLVTVRAELDNRKAKLEQVYSEMSGLRSTIEALGENIAQIENQRTRQVTELQATAEARDEQISKIENECNARVAELEATVEARDERISQIENERTAQVAEQKAIVKARDEQLTELTMAMSTPSARLARLLERYAKKLFPVRSLRRSALKRVLGFADRVYHYGIAGAFRMRKPRQLYGDSSLIDVVSADSNAQPREFARWIKSHEPDNAKLASQRRTSAPYNPEAPMFSVIVPVYKILPGVLEATIASVQNQTWQNWELCVGYADLDNESNWELLKRLAASDSRLIVHRLGVNGGISRNSNAVLEFARGEFIALLDHDDELTPWALADMAQRIMEVPEADFLYSDKDSINEYGTLRQQPLFKPAWSPEMLFSVNYLTHLNVMRRKLVKSVGGWDPKTDGAQDWDIFLRVTEVSRRIERVTGIHYHWRIIAGSTATGIDAKPYAALGQLRAIEKRVKRLGLPASIKPDPECGFHVNWQMDNKHVLDVVLHGGTSKTDLDSKFDTLLEQCGETLASVTLAWSGYDDPPAFRNRSQNGATVRTVCVPNRDKSSAVAEAIRSSSAPAVLLLDLQFTSLSPLSIKDLTGWVLKHPEIGFASAVGLLRDETVVEAGRVVGSGNQTLPLFRGMPLRHWGPLGGPLWYRNVSAAGDLAIVFDRGRLNPNLHETQPWLQALAAICADVCGKDRRGVVSPHARVFIESMPAEIGKWNEAMREDPYFHPSFRSVTPLEFGS